MSAVNSTRAGSSSARVLFTVAPETDEPLLGLVRRTAHANFLPHTLALTQIAGNAYGHRAGLVARDDQRIAELGESIGLSPDEALRRTPRPRADGTVTYLGSTYDSALLETRAFRFAPSALATSPHHRAIWDCRLLAYCPVTWQYLVEACAHCGTQQNWYHAKPLELCAACEADLRTMDVGYVGEKLRPSLSIVNDLLSPDPNAQVNALRQLPQALAGLPATSVLDLVARLLPAMSDNPQPEIFRLVRRDAPHRHAAYLAAAVDAVFAWESLDRTYHELRAHVGKKTLVQRRWRRALLADLARPGIAPFLTEARKMVAVAKAPMAKAPPRARGEARAKVDRPDVPREDDAINSRALSAMTGLSTREIAELRRSDVLCGYKTKKGAGTHIAYDKEVARELESYLKEGLGWETFARELGTGKHGVEQLACLHFISPSTHPAVVFKRGQLRFQKGDLPAFLEQIYAASTSLTALVVPVPLKMATSACQPGLTPWGPIMASMLSGRVKFAISDGPTPLLDRISVAWDALPVMRKLSFKCEDHPNFRFDDYLSMRETLHELGLQPKALPALREQGISEARGPNRRSVRICEVRRLSNRFVQTVELALRTGEDARDVRAQLKRQGLSKSLLGWSRSAAEEALADRLLLA